MTRKILGSEIVVGDTVRDLYGCLREVAGWNGSTRGGCRIAVDVRGWEFGIWDERPYKVAQMAAPDEDLSPEELADIQNICAPPRKGLTEALLRLLDATSGGLPLEERQAMERVADRLRESRDGDAA